MILGLVTYLIATWKMMEWFAGGFIGFSPTSRSNLRSSMFINFLWKVLLLMIDSWEMTSPRGIPIVWISMRRVESESGLIPGNSRRTLNEFHGVPRGFPVHMSYMPCEPSSNMLAKQCHKLSLVAPDIGGINNSQMGGLWHCFYCPH